MTPGDLAIQTSKSTQWKKTKRPGRRGKELPLLWRNHQTKKQSSSLRSEDFSFTKGLTREKLMNIFIDTRKTLRLILSKSASVYDPPGLLSSLMNQLCDVVRTATIYTSGDYGITSSSASWKYSKQPNKNTPDWSTQTSSTMASSSSSPVLMQH